MNYVLLLLFIVILPLLPLHTYISYVVLRVCSLGFLIICFILVSPLTFGVCTRGLI